MESSFEPNVFTNVDKMLSKIVYRESAEKASDAIKEVNSEDPLGQ
jgi:hypothetical protein